MLSSSLARKLGNFVVIEKLGIPISPRIFSLSPYSVAVSKDRIPNFSQAVSIALLHLSRPFQLIANSVTRPNCTVPSANLDE